MNSENPHILCVNPWIHDFAAYDFWSKPMGLLQIAALLRVYEFEVSFLDCLDRFNPREKGGVKVLRDGRGPYRKRAIKKPQGLENIRKRFSRYGIEPEWFRKDLENIGRVDAVLVSSAMTYWAGGVKETIRTVRDVFPDVPVVLGGIYATLCAGHARKYAGADVVVTGNGFAQLNTIIKDVTGVDAGFKHDPENRDTLPYPAFDMLSRIVYVPILTSEGCPFSCDYCAASFLAPAFRQRSPSAVFREIDYWHHRYGVKNFAFYDDALLVNKETHACILFEKLARADMDIWLHTPNALHIREMNREVCGLMKRAGVKTVRLGLETADFSASRTMDTKVNRAEFQNAVKNLKSAGFEASQIGAYLLCGLPGQKLEDVRASAQAVKETGIRPTLSFYTPIPFTPLWDKAKNHSRFDLEKDPVFTNNSVFPCSKAKDPEQGISELKGLCMS